MDELHIQRLRQVESHVVVLERLQMNEHYKGDVWDQSSWREPIYECGSAKCTAGWAVTFEALTRGDKDPWMNEETSAVLRALPAEIESGMAWERHVWDEKAGKYHDVMVTNVSDRAKQWLGLNADEVQALFHDTTTDIDEFRRTVQEIIDGEYR